jgi:hypothetical protein
MICVAIAIAACGPSPQPSPSPSDGAIESPSMAAAAPLTATDVEHRLAALDGSLRLVPTTKADDAGVFPALAFDARIAKAPTDGAPAVGQVLVYPTTAARIAIQPSFGPTSMQGPRGDLSLDGPIHSDWIGIDNVIVEVVMPGGPMGGRSPTPEEVGYPDRVRSALQTSR